MALWGNKDSKSVTGTIAVTNDSKAVVGTGTTFTTQLKSGNTLVIANVEYRVDSITDNTHLTLHVPYAGSTATGVSVTANEQPAYVSDDSLAQVYGVDTYPAGNMEAQMSENRARGLKTPGWVKYTTYQDSEGNTRHKVETLVAMGTIAGDAADDAVLADD
jgi:hypothetical protein